MGGAPSQAGKMYSDSLFSRRIVKEESMHKLEQELLLSTAVQGRKLLIR